VKLELKTLLEERDDLRKGSDVVVLQHKRQLEVRDILKTSLLFKTVLLYRISLIVHCHSDIFFYFLQIVQADISVERETYVKSR
jgi:hypothetical protein